jgi:hypothetical protein
VALLVARLGMGRVLAAALVERVIGRLGDPHLLCLDFIADNIFGRIDKFVLGMTRSELYVSD